MKKQQKVIETILKKNEALLQEKTKTNQDAQFFVQTHRPDSTSVIFRIKCESGGTSSLRLSVPVADVAIGQEEALRSFLMDKLVGLGYKVFNR